MTAFKNIERSQNQMPRSRSHYYDSLSFGLPLADTARGIEIRVRVILLLATRNKRVEILLGRCTVPEA